MNYLKDLGGELKGMMVGLEENKQKEIIRYVQDKVLESYRDGIEAGKKPKRNMTGKTGSKPRGGGVTPPPFILLKVRQSPTHPYQCKNA